MSDTTSSNATQPTKTGGHEGAAKRSSLEGSLPSPFQADLAMGMRILVSLGWAAFFVGLFVIAYLVSFGLLVN